MDDSPVASDDARELHELRARAYSPDSDIVQDPVALARLAELEDRRLEGAVLTRRSDVDLDASTSAVAAAVSSDAARLSAAASTEAEAASKMARSPNSSRWQRMTSTGSGRVRLAVGAGVTAVVILWGGMWLLGPHPDATLRLTATEADREAVALLMNANSLWEIDPSTLKSYEEYRGVELWSGVDDVGNPCLLLFDRSAASLLGMACAPQGDLIVDIGVWPSLDPDFAAGLPDGSIIRFHHDGDTVDAYLITAPDTD
jgi:hypothetical protein